MTKRQRAIALCRRAAEHPLWMNGDYGQHAIALGYKVRLVRGEPGRASADYEGRHMDAVELASHAWLAVDPEPLGIEGPHDPRRDEAAAQLLEKGWSPT